MGHGGGPEGHDDRLQAANAGSTTPTADRATARDHRRADSLVADAELRADLRARQAIAVGPGGVLADSVRQVRQVRLACCQSGLSGHLAHRAPVHIEPCRQLPNRNPRGVAGEQF